MKKLFFILSACMFFCSCAVMQSNVQTANVKAPVLSATVASLQVESAPITYVYTPSKTEAKALTIAQLVENAQYLALQQHGSGDVLVNVSYKLDMKKGPVVRRVKSITITGYPAKYKGFRNPTEEDRRNIETFYNNSNYNVAPAGTIWSRLKK